MTAYVALLRAVNVGGTGAIRMPDLSRVVAGLGYSAVRTWIQSGNVVFVGGTARTDAVERRIESALSTELDLRSDVIVRTASEWHESVASNPFTKEARNDPARLVLLSLKHAPPKAAVDRLRTAIVGREYLEAKGRGVYIVYPDGQGRSRWTGAAIERELGTRGTARNWNTVLRLDAMVSETPAPG